MTRITREQFISEFKHGDSDVAIDINNLTPSTKEKLKKAGVTKEDLAKIAGDDGKISGQQEYTDLYNKVDSFEKNNNSPEYFDTTDAKNVPTASGEAYEALKSQLDFNRAKSILRGPQPSKANTNPIAEGPQVSLFDNPRKGQRKKEGHKPELRPLENSMSQRDLWRAASPKERSAAINRELKARGYSFDDKSLQKAVKNGDVTALKLFIKGDFPGIQKTFLSKVEKGDSKTVQAFLDAGMDPNIRDKQGRTPLMLAGNPETVDALIAKDADVTAKNDKEGGKTVLIYQAENPVVISYKLLEKLKTTPTINGIPPLDVPDAHGKTALMYAASRDHNGTIYTLIKAGADKEALDRNKMTALTFAVENDNLSAAEELLKLGAWPNGGYADSRETPLNIAIRHGYWDMVQALCDTVRINPNLPDVDYKTALDHANERNDPDLVNLLRSRGALTGQEMLEVEP